jgi:hypothetical protein
MKKNKVISFIMILTLVLSSVSFSYGEQLFTDVPEDKWSTEFINKVSSEEIMPGFDDVTFKPKSNVSSLETLVIIYNMMDKSGKLSNVNIEEFERKYKDTINELKIPVSIPPYGEVVHKAVAFALEYKIVHPDELKFFIKDGKYQTAKKVDVSIFLGTALNLYYGENLNKLFALEYKDEVEITKVAKPYVNFLIEKEVLGKTGNEKGEFDPNSPITREVMAKMISTSYDGLLSSTKDTQVVSRGDDNVSSDLDLKPSDDGINTENIVNGTLEATIIQVIRDKNIIEVNDEFGNKKVYDLSTVGIFSDNKSLELSDLSIGDEIELIIDNTQLSRVNIKKGMASDKGNFESVSQVITEDDPYRVLTLVGEDGKKLYFKAYEKDLKVTIEGKEGKLDDIEFGDMVKVKSENLTAKQVIVERKEASFKAILSSSTDLKADELVSFKLDAETYREYKIAPNLEIKTKERSIEKGDIVLVRVEYGKVVYIEATGQVSEDTGTLKEIHISEEPYIVIMNKRNELVTYKVDPSIVIEDEIDNNSDLDIYYLRLNMDLNLKMGPEKVEKISVRKEIPSQKLLGTIKEIIHKESGLITITDAKGNDIIVMLDEVEKRKLDTYEVGDKIYLYGKQVKDNLFEAELILEVN